MKPSARSLLTAALAGLLLLNLPGPVRAQSSFTIDPPDPLTGFTSIAEWATPDDPEGWVTAQATTAVSGGVLSGTTDGIDPQLSRIPLAAPFPSPRLSAHTIEIRIRRQIGDTTPVQLYWTDTAGLAEARSVSVAASALPDDGNPHIIRFLLRNNVTTELRGLRLDPTRTSGATFEVDYVRIKSVPGTVLDPPASQLVNAYTSVGEWNTDGEFEGWNRNAHINPAGWMVAQGYLSGYTGPASFNDPNFSRPGLALDTTTGNFPIVEIRMRKDANDTSRVDLFRTDGGGAPGTPINQSSIAAWPADGAFHTVQFNIAAFATGTITAFRLDPIADKTILQNFSIDYVRVGRILPDTDGDGLADVVETGTGTYLSPTDTGTNPNLVDTDGDTFPDGIEVAFGTDPTKAGLFPAPLLSGYSASPAVYIHNLAITENAPVILNGSPTGYSISPPLPAGLAINPTTGIISGTPTALAAPASFTITANFAGGLTSAFQLSLEVRNPGIALYGANPATYRLNRAITANPPVLTGPAPTAWSITPALPDGLVLDPFSGTISGTPAIISPLTDYTITATYSGYPDATFLWSGRVLAAPVFLAADAAPVAPYTSIAEWETDGNNEGWTFANGNANASLGSLVYNATGADPQMTRAGLNVDPAGGTILEFRISQNDSAVVEIFWGDGTGGISPERRTEIPAGQMIGDGQFHTYQIKFDGVLSGNLTTLRIDPGTTAGRSVIFDYVRLGSAPAESGPVFTSITYDPLIREAAITWTSIAGRLYTLQTSPLDAEAPWTDVAAGISGEAGSTRYLDSNIPAGTTRRFYRIKP